MTIRLWNVADGQEVRRSEGHSDAVLHVAFSPDGTRTLSASAKEWAARLWDTSTGKVLHVFEGQGDRVKAIMYARQGAFVVTES